MIHHVILLALAFADPTGRPHARPFLNMPTEETTPAPARLSLTGAFADVRSLTPADGLLPYNVIVPFWSDGAEKRRWIALPDDGSGRPARIRVGADGEWSFPSGTVFVKHFEIAADATRPAMRRRLETRLIVRDARGGVFGVSYRWRPDGSDADLVREGRAEAIATETADGQRSRPWFFPGPNDCRQCHTPASGGVLGVSARQLDRPGAWNRLGLFDPTMSDEAIARLPRLARLDDPSRSLEDRARSYLDVNCAQCHRPGGVPADFDARYATPLAEQRLIGATVRIDLGVDSARAIAPNDPWRSAVLTRILTSDPTKMPPLAHETIDRAGADLVRSWIASLPGPPVLPPPTIRPGGGDHRAPVRVILEHPDRDATIRYTLDGSSPGKASPAYDGPFEVRRSTTVRARAFRPGSTRSVVVQETWIFGDGFGEQPTAGER